MGSVSLAAVVGVMSLPVVDMVVMNVVPVGCGVDARPTDHE